MKDETLKLIAYEHDKHKNALLKFLEKVGGSEKCSKRAKVIEWIHKDMPGHDRLPLRYVITQGDRIAGSMGHMPTEFLSRGQKFLARFTHDLLVDPDYRGQGLAKRLVNNALNTGSFFPGGMWMTGACYKLHLSCGFSDMKPLQTLTLALNPTTFLSKKEMSSSKITAAKVALRISRLKGLKRAASSLKKSNKTLNQIRSFNPNTDRRWLELLQTYEIGRIRNAAYLNWKYSRHPILTYQILLAEHADQVDGYIIWRLPQNGDERKRALITDFLVQNGDTETLEALIAKVILETSETEAEALTIVTSQSWVSNLLRRFGFYPKGTPDAWVIAGWKSVIPSEWINDLSKWHICAGDSDGDIWTGSQ